MKIDIENATVSWSEKDTVAYGNDFGGGVLFALDYLTEKAKEEQRWIPVTERLPEVSEKVIVCRKGGKVEQGIFCMNGWWKVYGTNTKTVTHWMPLPDAPKDGE